MKLGKYVITSKSGDSEWHKTSAKTLRGAKIAASRMYQTSVSGSIEIGIPMDDLSVVTLAVKYGYDKWIDIK